jgi:glc operon protein GlcG
MVSLIDAKTVGLEAARLALDAAIEKATELDLAVCIAVVDRGGHLLAYGRMDGAPLLSSQLSQDKAWTALAFRVATHKWWEEIKEAPAIVHGLSNIGRFIIIGGGIPIKFGGDTVGAVGVSGGAPEEDQAICQAGVDAVT